MGTVGEHQAVEGQAAAVTEEQALALDVDGARIADDPDHPQLAEPSVIEHDQLAIIDLPREEAGEVDAPIGQPRLARHHGDGGTLARHACGLCRVAAGHARPHDHHGRAIGADRLGRGRFGFLVECEELGAHTADSTGIGRQRATVQVGAHHAAPGARVTRLGHPGSLGRR